MDPRLPAQFLLPFLPSFFFPSSLIRKSAPFASECPSETRILPWQEEALFLTLKKVYLYGEHPCFSCKSFFFSSEGTFACAARTVFHKISPPCPRLVFSRVARSFFHSKPRFPTFPRMDSNRPPLSLSTHIFFKRFQVFSCKRFGEIFL